jgi:hypothetical protein
VSFVRNKQLFEPIEVQDPKPLSVAEQLNRLNEGIGVVPPRVCHAPEHRPHFKPKDIAIRPAEAPRAIREAQAPAIGFGAMETCPSLYFSGELNLPAPKVAAAAAQGPRIAATPVPAALLSPSLRHASNEEIDNLDIDTVAALILEDDGFGTFAALPEKRAPATASKARFAPLEVEEDLYTGVALELNRRNEGTNLPVVSLVTAQRFETGAPRANTDISLAVRLTREAVYAWVNVFTGTASVTVTQSKQRF